MGARTKLLVKPANIPATRFWLKVLSCPIYKPIMRLANSKLAKTMELIKGTVNRGEPMPL